MAFFDKLQEVAKTIGDKTSETMKVVGDKTSDAVEITKQKAKISQEKTAISDLKKQIGELVWNKYSEGKGLPEDIAELCAGIQEHLNVIAQAEADIENVKSKGESTPEAESVTEAVETEEHNEETTQETTDTVEE